MIQIRKSVFETNSSSSHSIVILKENKSIDGMIDPGWYVNDSGVLVFWENDIEFGRAPFSILTNWYNRACYAVASAAYDECMRDKIEDILYSHLAGLREIRYPRNQWYDEAKDMPEDRYFYGYIDHQSEGLLQRFLMNNDVSLKDFIFNDRYIVIIDGDEYNIFDTIRSLPTWNANAVEVIENA